MPARAFCLLCLFFFAVVATAAEEKKPKIAVMEIEDSTGAIPSAVLGNATEMLRGLLTSSGSFVVIDKSRQREKIQEMVKDERKESWKECYDQSCRIQLGQSLAADSILRTTISCLGKECYFSSELVDLAKEANVGGGTAGFVYDTDGAWSVNFSNGIALDYGKTNAYYVRCVRGGTLPDSAFTEETVSGKVVVTDTVTGLQWTKESSSTVNWQDALAHCETLDYGGHTDWRLPNIEELKTLIDDTIYDPASIFPDMPSPAYFWSSSTRVNSPDVAWDVGFEYGDVNYNVKSNDSINYARCVR